MSTFVQNFRGMLTRSFLAMPMLLFGWALFVGSTTGNIGLLVLAFGQATVTPLATWILHTIAGFFGESAQPYFTVPAGSSCNILPGGFTDSTGVQYSFPSYWLAQIFFFFGFLLSNAYTVLNMPAAPNASAEKVERRKSQAQLVLIMSSFFLLLMLFVRGLTGCETWLGVLVGGIVFLLMGNGWYQLARECSARDSDIFGIVQGILPPEASDPPPMTCVYTK